MHSRSWRFGSAGPGHSSQVMGRLPRLVSVRSQGFPCKVAAFGFMLHRQTAREVQNSSKRQSSNSPKIASMLGAKAAQVVEIADVLSSRGSGQNPTTSVLPSDSATPGCLGSRDPASMAPRCPRQQRGLCPERYLASRTALARPLIELCFKCLPATSPEWVGIRRLLSNSILFIANDGVSRLLELVGGDVSRNCGVGA